jgi:hydroxylaminobenzene mutase
MTPLPKKKYGYQLNQNNNLMNDQTSRKLKMLGIVLFLLGLITGFLIMTIKNPRMGLAAHLEGVMNGTFLVVAGFLWDELRITDKLKKVLFWTLLYGTFVNWLMTLLAGIWGTSKMTPLAGKGYSGIDLHERIVSAGLASVGLTMVFALIILVYGLRGKLDK